METAQAIEDDEFNLTDEELYDGYSAEELFRDSTATSITFDDLILLPGQIGKSSKLARMYYRSSP